MAPVNLEGCGRRDALRSALAVLKEVRSAGAVLPAVQSQAWAAVRVPGTSRTRHSTIVDVPVRPRGAGFGALPSRGLQRSVPARGHQAVATLNSAVTSRSFLTVSQARDALRRVVSTPLKLPRGARLASTPSRPVSSSCSGTRSSRPSASSCSGPRSATVSAFSSPGPSTQRTSSVEVSEEPFQLQDQFGAVSNNSMPVEAVRIALSSVTASTLSKYKLMFAKFKQFGHAKGINILEYSFSKVLFVAFLISIYKSKGSIGSLLMARASVKFYWVLNSTSESPSPTDSEFVQKFFKGLQKEKRIHNPATKAYPLTYIELQQLFSGICGNKDFSNLTFSKQRFIAMLILSYSSFTRFEEIQPLLVDQVYLVNADFSVNFRKGKRYLESRFGVIPNLPDLDFNPAAIFMQYREVVASLHASRNSGVDYLFPNSTTKKKATVLKDEPVKYDFFLRTLKKCPHS